MGSWGECTIQTCNVENSVFEYRPSLAANGLFIALYGLSALIHLFQGYWYKQRTFAILIVIGCITEMIGYGGRIMMYNNPWNFSAFIMQIVCITFAPVFMTAAIYVMLYKCVMKLSPASAAFKPSFYYLFFIPCDVVSLVLQAVGGAMSSQSDGSSQAGVNIGLAGLSFQVATLIVFIALAIQYAFRYRKDAKLGKVQVQGLDSRFKFFLSFLSLATILIFIRCVYRVYELSDGYSGPALHNQGEFIGLESCMVTIAVFALNIGHPGLVFDGRTKDATTRVESTSGYASDEVKDVE